MTELIFETEDADIAERSLPADDPAIEMDELSDALGFAIEADAVDLIEQHQPVPLPDDEWPWQHPEWLPNEPYSVGS